MNPEQQNYEFIMSSQKPQRGLGSLDPKKRIIVIVALFGVVLIFIALFFSLIRGGSSGGKNELIDLAAFQTELIRVSELGVKNGTGSVKNAAQTATLSLSSELFTTKEIASKQGVKIEDKSVVRYKSSETDAKLEEAQKSNQFNEVYAAFFDEQLLLYQKKLRQVYDTQKSTKNKTVFSSFNDNAISLRFSYTPEAKNE